LHRDPRQGRAAWTRARRSVEGRSRAGGPWPRPPWRSREPGDRPSRGRPPASRRGSRAPGRPRHPARDGRSGTPRPAPRRRPDRRARGRGAEARGAPSRW